MNRDCKNQIKKNVGQVDWLKGNKIYTKWKGYDNSFFGWIDKKYLHIKSELFSVLWSKQKQKRLN